MQDALRHRPEGRITHVAIQARAREQAEQDVRLYGSGFIKVMPNGMWERIDPRRIQIRPEQD